ncbi:hypothetical protein MKW94_011874 [Papaver nudicaule]|uniref:Uncharacterized protein n=1 Tax=Papaver nudicaule TaxID=74823 RepID=A0AA42AZE9_PAPNU|nr:hypothetical protein [Papaver nudicaule]
MVFNKYHYASSHVSVGVGGCSGGASLSAIDEFKFIQEQQQQQKQSHSQRLRDEPQLKLIDQFLSLQKASGEISLDMDLEMYELVGNSLQENPSDQPPPKTSYPTSPQAIPQPVPHPLRRRNNQNGREETDEVVRCTSNDAFKRSSNSSFQRNSNSGFFRTKNMKSRLMDPPADTKSGRVPTTSGQIRSGFIEDDIPDKYKTSKFFSPIVILQWASLIIIMTAFIGSLTIHELSKRRLWALPPWKWELIIFVLICGRLVSGWGIRILVFFIERNCILRKRVLYFVYGLRKAVQNCLWLDVVLLAWHYLFEKKVITREEVIPVFVTKFLILLLVGTLLWLLKTLLVKVLASSFHVSTYFDRIQESLFTQYVIETFSGPPMIEIQRNQEEEEQVMAEVEHLQNAGCTMPPPQG